MTRQSALALFALAASAAACTPRNEVDADSNALPAVDTLKGVAATDTLPTTATDTPATKTATKSAPTKATGTGAKTPATKTTTKAGRDSAIQPPNLPQLDTVKKKPPVS